MSKDFNSEVIKIKAFLIREDPDFFRIIGEFLNNISHSCEDWEEIALTIFSQGVLYGSSRVLDVLAAHKEEQKDINLSLPEIHGGDKNKNSKKN